ncbi:MAG: DnaJ domain-containing protein [Candidatus Aenigmatarchaeota archaeon]
MKNYYSILGIPPDSSEKDIKKKFRELVKKYHPDKGGDSEKFKEILEAYMILSDKEKRKEYDYEFFYNKEDFENINEDKTGVSLRKSDTVDLNLTPLFRTCFILLFYVGMIIIFAILFHYVEKYKKIFEQDRLFSYFLIFSAFAIYGFFIYLGIFINGLLEKKGVIIKLNKNNPLAFILNRWLQIFYTNFSKLFLFVVLIFVIYLQIKEYLSSYIDYDKAITEYWDEIYPYLDDSVPIEMCNDSYGCGEVEAEIFYGNIKKIYLENDRHLNLDIPILNDLTAEYYDSKGNYWQFRIPRESQVIIEGVFCWAENSGYKIRNLPDIGIKLNQLKCREQEEIKGEAMALFIYFQNEKILKKERWRTIVQKFKENPKLEEAFMNLLEKERLRKILPSGIPPEIIRWSSIERAYFIDAWIKKHKKAGASKEEILKSLQLLETEGILTDKVMEIMHKIKYGSPVSQEIK